MSYLKTIYDSSIKKQLIDEFSLKNPMEVPKLEKIVLNMGVGSATQDKKKIETAQNDLTLISGQHALIVKAKKSVATFKLREGMPIGVKVTLRNNNMYRFLDKLIYIALPRVKDFRGLSLKSFDTKGNFSFGVKEHIIFPEIDYDKTDTIRGMDVTIVTNCSERSQSIALLKALKIPFSERR